MRTGNGMFSSIHSNNTNTSAAEVSRYHNWLPLILALSYVGSVLLGVVVMRFCCCPEKFALPSDLKRRKSVLDKPMPANGQSERNASSQAQPSNAVNSGALQEPLLSPVRVVLPPSAKPDVEESDESRDAPVVVNTRPSTPL